MSEDGTCGNVFVEANGRRHSCRLSAKGFPHNIHRDDEASWEYPRYDLEINVPREPEREGAAVVRSPSERRLTRIRERLHGSPFVADLDGEQ